MNKWNKQIENLGLVEFVLTDTQWTVFLNELDKPLYVSWIPKIRTLRKYDEEKKEAEYSLLTELYKSKPELIPNIQDLIKNIDNE